MLTSGEATLQGRRASSTSFRGSAEVLSPSASTRICVYLVWFSLICWGMCCVLRVVSGRTHPPRARKCGAGGTHRCTLGECYRGLQFLRGVEHLAEGHLHVGLYACVCSDQQGTNEYVCDRRGSVRPYLSRAEPDLPKPHVLQRAHAPTAGHSDLCIRKRPPFWMSIM